MNIRTDVNVKKNLRALPFEQRLQQENYQLTRQNLDIVQVNVGRRCNQSCLHCHVEAGPNRPEVMGREMALQVIDFVQATQAKTVDLTGGAPELNPSFRLLVEAVRQAGKQVIVRSNLTVMSEPGMEDLPEFFAAQGVEVVASMPCYTLENVDQQRGHGAYEKSIRALRRLNALGYGREGSGRVLNLVYNPLGAFLPGPQADLEADYKRELDSRWGIAFNHLYTITNVNLGRFSRMLKRQKEVESYASLLAHSFNPATLTNLMCVREVSLSWDGYFYDCDFNQILDIRLGNGRAFRLGQAPVAKLADQLVGQKIHTGEHCYACTAGAGSSCTGALV